MNDSSWSDAILIIFSEIRSAADFRIQEKIERHRPFLGGLLGVTCYVRSYSARKRSTIFPWHKRKLLETL